MELASELRRGRAVVQEMVQQVVQDLKGPRRGGQALMEALRGATQAHIGVVPRSRCTLPWALAAWEARPEGGGKPETLNPKNSTLKTQP